MSVALGRQLPVSFFARDTVRVARDLLGCLLESRVGRQRTVGRIVEVEAYVGPDDPADHGFRNRQSPRNAALFGPPGTAYVFRAYGVHWCFNAVTEREGFPSAVLVRALQPMVGQQVMARRRGTVEPRLLCSGPGRLCQALGITGAQNGILLGGKAIRLRRPTPNRRGRIVRGPRIGISRATDWPLRFYIEQSPWRSR